MTKHERYGPKTEAERKVQRAYMREWRKAHPHYNRDWMRRHRARQREQGGH